MLFEFAEAGALLQELQHVQRGVEVLRKAGARGAGPFMCQNWGTTQKW